MKQSNLDKIFETIRNLSHKKILPTHAEGEFSGKSFLVIGLGNPGREYQNTRHNIGFTVADKLAERLGAEFTRTKSKSLITNARYHGSNIIIAKPQTFMNKSGFAIRSLFDFYKVDHVNFLVAYDDVDLPYGAIRIKPSGGTAGHKGIKSIVDQLGTSTFPRMRLGVGRPPGSKDAASYVLKSFTADETDFLSHFINRAVDAVLSFTANGIDFTMTNFNKVAGI